MFYLVFFRILCTQAILTKGFPGESESHSVMSNSLRPHGLSSLWNSPGQKTGVESCALLQGIFPTQGSNPGLPHCRKILYLPKGFPSDPAGKEPACVCRRCRFNPWVKKMPWRRKQQPTPVFLPGKSQEQRSLMGSSPQGCKRVRHNLATQQQQHSN